jgi:hypothetical protein
VSAQLVPFDAALQTLLSISGVLFLTWFLVHLKNILIRCVFVCFSGGYAAALHVATAKTAIV